MKIESDSYDFSSTPGGKSMVDLTNTPDCRMSKNLSLLRNFSKYTPDSNTLNRNIFDPTEVKVEEPCKISGIDSKRKPEEQLQNEIKPERENEVAECSKVKESSMLANHQSGERILYLHTYRKVFTWNIFGFVDVGDD